MSRGSSTCVRDMSDYSIFRDHPNLPRAFLQACQHGNLSRVEALVSRYRIDDWTKFRYDISGDTPLHLAAREGHLNVVEYLCENFGKSEFIANVTNNDTKTPLHDAAQFSHSAVLEYLIKQSASYIGSAVDSLKRGDWTPLMLACTKSGPEARKCVNSLLQSKANPLLYNKDGWNPLHIACRSGDENICETLIRLAPECVEKRSKNGRSSMHIAAFNGHKAIIDLLAAANSNLLYEGDSSGSMPLHEAAKGGNLDVVKRTIELGASVAACDSVGQNILHITSLSGNVEVLKYILDGELLDVNQADSFGLTPLAAARKSKKLQAVELLLISGAKE